MKVHQVGSIPNSGLQKLSTWALRLITLLKLYFDFSRGPILSVVLAFNLYFWPSKPFCFYDAIKQILFFLTLSF